MEHLLSHGLPVPQGVEAVFWSCPASFDLAGLVLLERVQGREDFHHHLLCCFLAEVAVGIQMLEKSLEGIAVLVLEETIVRSMDLALSEEQPPVENLVDPQTQLYR